ncbi:MAG: hypothetical protein OXF49_01500 [Candidatus Saccharibacteria bacterium]|nr:hypothetical protein [Candidatus Saccharibacteria bacterium]
MNNIDFENAPIGAQKLARLIENMNLEIIRNCIKDGGIPSLLECKTTKTNKDAQNPSIDIHFKIEIPNHLCRPDSLFDLKHSMITKLNEIQIRQIKENI